MLRAGFFRFQSGLVDVQPPNFEVRVAILSEKVDQNGLSLIIQLLTVS